MAMTLPHSTLPCGGRIRRYILLLAGEGGMGVRGRAMLQKMLYVLTKDIGDGGVESTFKPHDYGPYSQQAADELDGLSRDGLVSRASGKVTLTPAGRAAAEDAGRSRDEIEAASLRGCKRFFNSLSSDQALLYIHLLYPDMATDSRAHNDIALRAEDIVMGMVKEGKISQGRAAEMLKVPYRDILDMMGRRGIVNLY